jgi:hypothetical protein
LSPHCKLIFLEDGDHSFKPRVKSGFTFAEHMESAAENLCNFISVNTRLTSNV